MKKYIAVVAVITALNTALQFMSLTIDNALPILKIGAVSAWMVRNLDGKNTTVSTTDMLVIAWLILCMLVIPSIGKTSDQARAPLALFLAGLIGNASNHILSNSIIVNPFYIMARGHGWIAFNLADVIVYLGLIWYTTLCMVWLWKAMSYIIKTSALSTKESSREAKGFGH